MVLQFSILLRWCIVMVNGQDFERDLVKAFNAFFEQHGTKAIAYRKLQTRYQPQIFDIMVDCRGNELYLAIECKQVNSDNYDTVYFSHGFSNTKGVHQIKRESDWLDLSGRNGLLAVESWSPSHRKRKAFLIPWHIVEFHFLRGDKNIPQSVITSCPCLHKQGGKYIIDTDDMAELVRRLDNPPRKIPRKWMQKNKSIIKKGDE